MDEKLLNLLSKIKYPGMERDIVDFKMVKIAEFTGNDEILIVLKNISNEEKFNQLKKEIEELLKKEYPGKRITVELVKKDVKNVKVGAQIGEKKKSLSHIKHVIAVGSGKGGVGKSTVAVNLAIAMAKKGYKVGLLDADIWGPSVPTMLGTEDKRPYVNEKKKVLPIENYGIYMMSIGYFIEKNMPLIWRGPLVTGALKQLMNDVEWPELDYMFIDMPPGTGDIQLTLTQDAKVDGVVIVSTPQKVAYIDAIKGVVMFQKLNIPIIGIVENMSYFECPDTGKKHYIFGKGGGEYVSSNFNVNLIGQIPIDPKVTIQGDEGVPIVQALPDSPVTKAYMEACDKIVKFTEKKA